ncbi:MAG: hypothetical protein RI907_2737 [Pseudomonadota bacterium]|jgi:glutaredoxin
MSTHRLSTPAWRATAALALVGLMTSLPTPVWALYKVVGPDGRVTYTDRPEPAAKASKLRTPDRKGDGTAGLPYALQQAATRYPVVLLTSQPCAPCQSGRDWLRARGIPFQEMTVNTSEDTQALKRLSGSDQVPVLRVGSQVLSGYQTQEWASYLDLAGYPASAQLPASYVWPEAQPLAGGKPKAADDDARANRPSPSAPPPFEPEDAPRGFRF